IIGLAHTYSCVMFNSIAFILRSLVSPLLNIVRPLFRGGARSEPPPSARARARAQLQKTTAASTPKQSQSKQQPRNPKQPMEPATASPAVEEKSKLAEQATAKGELSYSYWAGKGGGGVPLPEPRKLTDQEKEELERQASANGASAWNAAGTFEERNASAWAKARLKELLVGLRLAGGEVEVLDVNSCEGEANIFLVRGKKRCGFDFELQLAWKAVPRPGAVEIRGHCKVLNFSSDDPDDLEVRPEVGARQPERAADEAAAMARVKAVLQPELVRVLGQLLEELKQK
ncbi:hypothetical protein Agub_g8870, partial [Astrephomene gubernaculifera]